MTSRAATLTFASVLAAALLVRCLLVFSVPFGPVVERRLEGLNDEPAHLNYVKYLVEHRSFPVQIHHSREPGAFERGDFEYYQPPLYYLVCAPLYAAVAGRPAAVTLCRMVSFACGILSLIVLGRILGRLGGSESSRRAGVAFLALLPTHAYFSSVASNDAMSWLIALRLTQHVLDLLETARPGTPPIGTRSLVGSGLLLAGGLLAKTSVAILLPAVVLAHAHVASRRREGSSFLRALLPLGIAVLIAGPWYGRNLLLYGSLSGLAAGFGPPESGLASAAGVAHTLKATVRYFWFPMQHVASDSAVLALRYLGAVLLAVHGGLGLGYLRRAGPGDLKVFMLVFILASAIVSQLTVGMSWGNVEGRFLFPALAPIVFFMVAPVFALIERSRRDEGLAWLYLSLVAAHPYVLLAFA